MSKNGAYYLAAGVGGLFVYAGIRGYSPLRAAQNLIQGQPANAGQAVSLIGAPDSGILGVPGGSMVQIARSTIGHPYKWDGSPGRDGRGAWDCSSAFNWWSTQAGFPIPGFPHGWDYSGHGPNTLLWIPFGGMTTVGHKSNLAQPGDACIWQTHMGLCVAPGRMVSALNPREGTKETEIDIIKGEVLFVRRFKANTGEFGGGNL